MKDSDLTAPLKLAAIDLDGTLLGPNREISPENRHAVRQLQQAGLQVVLASGRHYLNMRRYADALPGVEWLVSCQGGESASTSREVVLNRDFLPAMVLRHILEMGLARGLSTVAYTVDGVLTTAGWNAELAFYADLAGRSPQPSAAPGILEQSVFKVIWMGAPEAIDLAGAASKLPVGVEKVRTHERMLEIMPAGVTKATGLQRIADRMGVDASEAIVFGDGDNDVPMFEWAGASYAMAHGWPAARQSATHTTPAGPLETAFSRGVRHAFECGLLSATHAGEAIRTGQDLPLPATQARR